MNIAFICGSPRSGTTILSEILDRHPQIQEWYEPYYIWAYHFDIRSNDIWIDDDLTDKALRSIRREFKIFTEKSGARLVLDKSPGHALNIKIISKIFPTAKWIHAYRDGRDVTLSIKKEWETRKQMVASRDLSRLYKISWTMLKRQPYWRYRLKAILFEIKNHMSLNPKTYLNKSKWRGKPYWGPRFEGWERYLSDHSPLEFNAMQWVKLVEAVRRDWDTLPEENKIEIKYEDLLRSTKHTLTALFRTLGLQPANDFYDNLPKLKEKNYGKWRHGFAEGEIHKIRPILTPMLCELGYENCLDW